MPMEPVFKAGPKFPCYAESDVYCIDCAVCVSGYGVLLNANMLPEKEDLQTVQAAI